MYRKCTWLMAGFVCLIALLSAVPVLAQEPSEEPVVFAVLFFSPTCPHCHYVIQDTLPKLQQEFGDQLEMLFVDVTTAGGRQVLFAACTALNVADDRCGNVPMMVIGSEVLFGSVEIPEKAPGLIRNGLAQGGIGLPPIPGLEEAYQAALAAQQRSEPVPTQAAESSGDVAATVAPAVEPVQGQSVPEDTAAVPDAAVQPVSYRLADRVANWAAIGVLLALILSAGASMLGGIGVLRLEGLARVAALLSALIGFGLSVTLVVGPGGGLIAVILAVLVALIMLLAAIAIFRLPGRATDYPAWLVPVVVVGGLIVAGYLSYVELTQVEAVCGAMGDCNVVQQSAYARLFGIIPVGLLGLAGYAAIGLFWLIGRTTQGRLRGLAHIALLGMTLFGVLFSAYLTFLEPFVIGASCVWCLISAVGMMLILWLVAPQSWRVLHLLDGVE